MSLPGPDLSCRVNGKPLVTLLPVLHRSLLEKTAQALDFNEGVVNAVVHGKLPALLGWDRSFLPHPSPCAWEMLTVPVHIDPIPLRDAGGVKLMNSIKIRILSRMCCPWLSGWFVGTHLSSCSKDLVGPVVVWRHWEWMSWAGRNSHVGNGSTGSCGLRAWLHSWLVLF